VSPGKAPKHYGTPLGRLQVLHALVECGGNRDTAARRLKIHRSTIYDAINRYARADEKEVDRVMGRVWEPD
jgi:transposase